MVRGVDVRFFKNEKENREREFLKKLEARRKEMKEVLDKWGLFYKEEKYEIEERETYDMGFHFFCR